MATANELFLDAILRHQIGLASVSEDIQKKAFKLLNDTEKDLRAEIRRRLQNKPKGLRTPAAIRRMKGLVKSLKTIRVKAWAKSEEQLVKAIKDITRAEVEFMGKALQSSVPVVLDPSLPSAALVTNLVDTRPFRGAILKDWTKQTRLADVNRIEQQVRIGMVAGEDSAAIARRVVGTVRRRGTDGVTEITRRQAKSLTRTAVNAFSNSAKQAFYAANSDIFGEEQYVSTLDSRTCWSEDTLITMADGSQKPIGKVREGDYVLGGLTNKPCRVQGIHKTIDKCNVVMYINGEWIGHTTPEHKLLTVEGWQNAEMVCLHPYIQKRQVLCRHDTQCKAENGQSLGSGKEGKETKEKEPSGVQRVAEVRATGIEDSFRTFRDRTGVSGRKGSDKEFENATPQRLQCDGRRGRDLWSTERVAQGMGKESLCGIDELLPRKPRGHEQANETPLERFELPGTCEQSPGGSAEGKTRKRSRLGKKQTRESIRIYEKEVARSGIPQTACGCSGETGSTEEVGEQWAQGCGGVNGGWPEEETGRFPEVSNRKMVTAQNAWGYKSDRPVVIVSLTIEGDHTYQVGRSRLIVHNTPICRSLDGKRYPPGQGPTPPQHFQCRSIRVAVINGEVLGYRPAKPFTERMLLREYAAKNNLGRIPNRAGLPRGHKGAYDLYKRGRVRELTGRVPARVNYQEWLTGQSAEFQDDLLGKSRGLLFRKGGLTLDKFVSPQGKTIPLRELIQKENAAFAKAGVGVNDIGSV